MKVVLDTNVLVSGIFYSGPPSAILRAWKQGKFRLITTPQILEEYRAVATRLGKRFPGIEITRIIDLVLVKNLVAHQN